MGAVKTFLEKESNKIGPKETKTVGREEVQQFKPEGLQKFLREEKEKERNDKVEKAITLASVVGSAIGAMITLYSFAVSGSAPVGGIPLTQAAGYIAFMTSVILHAEANALMNLGLSIMVFSALGGIVATIAYDFFKGNKKNKQ